MVKKKLHQSDLVLTVEDLEELKLGENITDVRNIYSLT